MQFDILHLQNNSAMIEDGMVAHAQTLLVFLRCMHFSGTLRTPDVTLLPIAYQVTYVLYECLQLKTKSTVSSLPILYENFFCCHLVMTVVRMLSLTIGYCKCNCSFVNDSIVKAVFEPVSWKKRKGACQKCINMVIIHCDLTFFA